MRCQSLQVTAADREREELIRKHYEAKSQQLLAQIQAADEKALEISTRLQRELDLSQQERNSLRKQLADSTEALRAAKEDLELTRSNYEGNIKVLSENLIEKTERLARKENEAAQLRGAKTTCPKCRTILTIDALLKQGR